MEKFKVKVTNASEVLEIENILSKIGLVARDYSGFSYPKYIANNIDGEFSDYTMFDSGIDEFKLLTINELKDMGVLMQNNPKDANVYQDGDIPCLYDLYLTENKELYFYHCGKKAWILSNLNHDKDYYELLKPIKGEAMKESLNNKIATAEVARQKTTSQWDLQVGGDHYKAMKIQPAKFALENKLDYCQANAIKYICRHESKNGKQDLEKAKHYIDLLIEHYYGDNNEI
ncbi:MAG: DUF3310 domain-containing protein [Acinetobacter sp.]